MALGRFVVTSTVPLTPDTAATVTAGEPGTGGGAGYGNSATVSPGTSGKYGWLPLVFPRERRDRGRQPGQDDVGPRGISN
jgi:hypothetical protein